MATIDDAIKYVRENIDMEQVNMTTTLIYEHHGSLETDDPFHLKEKIADLMEEYSDDNDLPEGWWLYEAGEEDILMEL